MIQWCGQFNNGGYLKKETNMKRIISILLVVTTTLSLALTGCSGNKNSTASTSDNNASSEPTEGGSITVGISQDLDSLDPHLAVSAGTKEV